MSGLPRLVYACLTHRLRTSRVLLCSCSVIGLLGVDAALSLGLTGSQVLSLVKALLILFVVGSEVFRVAYFEGYISRNIIFVGWLRGVVFVYFFQVPLSLVA